MALHNWIRIIIPGGGGLFRVWQPFPIPLLAYCLKQQSANRLDVFFGKNVPPRLLVVFLFVLEGEAGSVIIKNFGRDLEEVFFPFLLSFSPYIAYV